MASGFGGGSGEAKNSKINQNSTKMVSNEEITGKCDVLINMLRSVFSLISANMEVILRRISTLSDDRLISTVSAATCLDKGLGSRVGVGWQLSKCWNIC